MTHLRFGFRYVCAGRPLISLRISSWILVGARDPVVIGGEQSALSTPLISSTGSPAAAH